MSPKQRRYLVLTGCVGPAFANALFNGPIGWLVTVAYPMFPVWTIPGAAADLVATAGGVAFGTCIAMMIQVKRDFKRGRISAPPISGWMTRWLVSIPRGMLQQSVGCGIWGILLFAFPVVLVLFFSGASALDRVTFTWLKTVLSALDAALIAPLVALKALLDLSGPQKTPTYEQTTPVPRD
jgi:hypothetical protein